MLVARFLACQLTNAPLDVCLFAWGGSAGFVAKDMRDVGYSLEELMAGQFTASDLRGAAYYCSEMRSVGFTIAQLRTAGYSGSEMRIAGFAALEMKDAGFTAKKARRPARKVGCTTFGS